MYQNGLTFFDISFWLVSAVLKPVIMLVFMGVDETTE